MTDTPTCPMCGGTKDECGKRATQIHHIVAVGNGGDTYERSNLTPVCAACHEALHAMNATDTALMSAPSHIAAWCGICGSTRHIEHHHIVPRSRGGHDGPTVTLCRDCHARHHSVTPYVFAYDTGWLVETADGWCPLVESTGMESA